MVRNKRLQGISMLMIIGFTTIACVIGAKMLADTISLMLIQESMQADKNLVNRVLSFFSFYGRTHLYFYFVSGLVLVIAGYTLWKDKTFKVAYFIIAMMLLSFVLLLMNRGFSQLIHQSQNLIATLPVEKVFDQGKDFISMIGVVLSKLTAAVSSTVVKSLLFDIVVLLIYLLTNIVMFVRISDKSKK